MRTSSPDPPVTDKKKLHLQLSDKNREVFGDRPNADIGIVEDPSFPHGDANNTAPITRPALELIMYILLGLFILIALIFAVNCGAMMARYRWENARGAKEAQRLQTLSELAVNNANTDVEGAVEYSSSSTADLNSQMDQTDALVSVRQLGVPHCPPVYFSQRLLSRCTRTTACLLLLIFLRDGVCCLLAYRLRCVRVLARHLINKCCARLPFLVVV